MLFLILRNSENPFSAATVSEFTSRMSERENSQASFLNNVSLIALVCQKLEMKLNLSFELQFKDAT